jgi:UDPglucose--hexose-1-phosphate uridylyltransferase
MPEIRHDPIAGRWVIIAENRAARPEEFASRPKRGAAECPFCGGNEKLTPDALAVYPAGTADSSWRVRVFANKYPAATSNDTASAAAAANGIHEVIVESPSHVVSLSQVSDEDARLAFAAYRHRLCAAKQHDRMAHSLIFKNARAEGGASLEHTHSQLIVTEDVPPQVQLELARAGEHLAIHGRCVFCDLISQELDAGRSVLVGEHFVAVCPYASRFPYETWILPKTHRASFEDATAAELNDLAAMTQDIIRRLESLLTAPAYNYWIRTAPFTLSQHDDYHWHLELMPRMTRLAGFELATGCFINPVSPEQAAGRLRSAS